MKSLDVLYEDNHIIAVNKPAGVLVQGDKTGDEPLSEKVKAYIKKKYKKPGDVYLGIPHRIDRPVSGVVVFARTSKALTRLNKMFQAKDKEIQKIYWAIVENTPREDEEVLQNYLRKNPNQNKSYVCATAKDGAKLSTLEYRLLAHSQKYFLLEVKLHTGRHHQIRCQLAAIGNPIRGDLKYGAKRSIEGGGIGLHARVLRFIHPVKKEPIEIVAPVPKENIWQDLQQIVG
ncbi:RluA family pseudouridine synthase [Balneicella halophila]|uniref:RluA family pseudouridine synthase n=1 Tax=Balneicella halophila TaxID=1537566 RepID=A0A7L4UQJ3_BALHA|nr:RNA pseudouridine synthase [Balneicella halophila]PVX52045.1 RluA family pseudouridine synthase [Balneicella halophila]